MEVVTFGVLIAAEDLNFGHEGFFVLKCGSSYS